MDSKTNATHITVITVHLHQVKQRNLAVSTPSASNILTQHLHASVTVQNSVMHRSQFRTECDAKYLLMVEAT